MFIGTYEELIIAIETLESRSHTIDTAEQENMVWHEIADLKEELRMREFSCGFARN